MIRKEKVTKPASFMASRKQKAKLMKNPTKPGKMKHKIMPGRNPIK